VKLLMKRLTVTCESHTASGIRTLGQCMPSPHNSPNFKDFFWMGGGEKAYRYKGSSNVPPMYADPLLHSSHTSPNFKDFFFGREGLQV